MVLREKFSRPQNGKGVPHPRKDETPRNLSPSGALRSQFALHQFPRPAQALISDEPSSQPLVCCHLRHKRFTEQASEMLGELFFAQPPSQFLHLGIICHAVFDLLGENRVSGQFFELR